MTALNQTEVPAEIVATISTIKHNASQDFTEGYKAEARRSPPSRENERSSAARDGGGTGQSGGSGSGQATNATLDTLTLGRGSFLHSRIISILICMKSFISIQI